MKLAFYKGTHKDYTGLFNRLVRWWCRSEYSHVELVVDYCKDGLSLCASSTGKTGVRFIRTNLDTSEWDTVDISHMMSLTEEIAAYDWFAANSGKGYDYQGIFGFILRRVKEKPNKYLCSEAVATALGYVEGWRFDVATLHRVVTRTRLNHVNG